MYPPAALVEVHLDRETEVANSALHLIVVDPTLAVCSLWVLSHTSLVLPRCVFFFWFRNGLFVFSHPRKLFFCFSSLLLPIRCLLNLFLQLVWYVRCVCWPLLTEGRQLLSLCPHTESVMLWRKRSRSFGLWCFLRSWCLRSFLGKKFRTFYVLCCLFPLFCLVVFFGLVCVFCLQRVAVCHIHSFGRPARRNPHLLTFRSISARWFSARVCSFGFYGFFPLCLAPENYIVIVTVALTGLPAV